MAEAIKSLFAVNNMRNLADKDDMPNSRQIFSESISCLLWISSL